MNDEIKTDATQALADTKTAIAKLETDVTTGEKSLVVRVETAAKTFYETHLPLIAALGGFCLGALVMLAKLKL